MDPGQQGDYFAVYNAHVCPDVWGKVRMHIMHGRHDCAPRAGHLCNAHRSVGARRAAQQHTVLPLARRRPHRPRPLLKSAHAPHVKTTPGAPPDKHSFFLLFLSHRIQGRWLIQVQAVRTVHTRMLGELSEKLQKFRPPAVVLDWEHRERLANVDGERKALTGD